MRINLILSFVKDVDYCRVFPRFFVCRKLHVYWEKGEKGNGRYSEHLNPSSRFEAMHLYGGLVQNKQYMLMHSCAQKMITHDH